MENTNLVPTANVPQEWSMTSHEDNMILELTNDKVVSYCSYKPKNDAEKIELYNAVNNAEKRLSESANMELKIKHVFVEIVECINQSTGLPEKCPRVVLIDEKGEGYTAVSIGVFSSLKKIFGIFGTAETWKKPLTIVPKQITKGDKKITTLQVRA